MTINLSSYHAQSVVICPLEALLFMGSRLPKKDKKGKNKKEKGRSICRYISEEKSLAPPTPVEILMQLLAFDKPHHR